MVKKLKNEIIREELALDYNLLFSEPMAINFEPVTECIKYNNGQYSIRNLWVSYYAPAAYTVNELIMTWLYGDDNEFKRYASLVYNAIKNLDNKKEDLIITDKDESMIESIKINWEQVYVVLFLLLQEKVKINDLETLKAMLELRYVEFNTAIINLTYGDLDSEDVVETIQILQKKCEVLKDVIMSTISCEWHSQASTYFC